MQGEVIRHTRLIRYCIYYKKLLSWPCISTYKSLETAKSLFQLLTERDDTEDAILCITAEDIIRRKTPDNKITVENKFQDEVIAIFSQL